MKIHYSQPKGFVGRTIAYAIFCDEHYYGHILGGSATLYLPNRNAFFDISQTNLNQVVNNIFFNVSPIDGRYPHRNFTSKVLRLFEKTIIQDWYDKYGDRVIGFETLVEPPRTGEVYQRCGWSLLGKTKGYTCKRIAGKGYEKWGGRRVWNYQELRPKLVFAKAVST